MYNACPSRALKNLINVDTTAVRMEVFLPHVVYRLLTNSSVAPLGEGRLHKVG